MHVAGVASGIARVKAKLEPVVKKKIEKKIQLTHSPSTPYLVF